MSKNVCPERILANDHSPYLGYSETGIIKKLARVCVALFYSHQTFAHTVRGSPSVTKMGGSCATTGGVIAAAMMTSSTES